MAFVDLSAPVMAYVGMGSNLGNRQEHLLGAVAALRATHAVETVRLSGVFETEAVDCAEPLPFLNAVAAVQTRLPVRAFFERLVAIETSFARQRTYRHAPRTLDLDLLAFGQMQVQQTDLIVPHPRLHERLFVCVPFEDVAPEWRHPVTQKTLPEMLEELRAQRLKPAEPMLLRRVALERALVYDAVGTPVADTLADR